MDGLISNSLEPSSQPASLLCLISIIIVFVVVVVVGYDQACCRQTGRQEGKLIDVRMEVEVGAGI